MKGFKPGMVVSMGALLAISLWGGTGCSALLTGTSANQCTVASDCSAFGVNYTCQQGLCVPPQEVTNTPDGAATGCSTTAQCTADRGGPSLCNTPGGQCEDLFSEQCTVTGNYADPNAIFIANLTGFTSLDPFVVGHATPANNLIQLAYQEFAQTVPNGLPGLQNGVRRPLVLLTCEVGDNNSSASLAVAQHLAVIQPSVVISPSTGITNAYVTAVPKVPPTKLPFYMITDLEWGSAREIVAGSGNPSNVYQGQTPWNSYAAAYGPYFQAMIKQVKADPRFSGGPIKVAVLTELSPSLDWSNVVDVVVAQLNPFNGGSASDPVNKNNFLQVAYDVTNPQSQAEAAAALVGLAPQIIFTIGGEGELELVAPFVEANWPAGVMPPRYIGGEPQMGYSQLGFFQGNVELMNRISTIRVQNGAFYRNDLLGGGLGSRYKAMFPQALWLGALGGDSTAQAYDLFYATMYAIVAAGAPLDPTGHPYGQDIAAGLLKLKQGTLQAWVGLENLPTTLVALEQGPVNLFGLVNPLSFDPTTGFVPQTTVQYSCWLSPVQLSASGISWSASTPSTFAPGSMKIECAGVAGP